MFPAIPAFSRSGHLFTLHAGEAMSGCGEAMGGCGEAMSGCGNAGQGCGMRARRHFLTGDSWRDPNLTTQGRRLDAVLKHLTALRAAGLVLTNADREDGRRLLYSFSPAVTLRRTTTGMEMDFGCCLLRF